MKTLEELLNSASDNWTQQSKQTIAASEESIIRRMRNSNSLSSGITAIVTLFIAGGMWLYSELTPNPSFTPGELSPRPSPAERGAIASASASLPDSELTPNPSFTPGELTPNPSPAERGAIASASLPDSELSPRPSPAERGAIASALLTASADADGFAAEYERVLARAQALEQTNTLAAMNEYAGLAQLCERRNHWEFAVSAWQLAQHMAENVGDKQVLARMTQSLESARVRVRN